MSRSTFGRLYFQTKLAICVLIMVVVGIVTVLTIFRPRKQPDSLQVPLGVEQAAIVTYSGPPVTVAPYKWGVAVNVRIAQVTAQAGARVYDVRYIVNRPGTFDLKDYLISADGQPLAGLPSFKFEGDPKLSKTLESRIQETEQVAVEIGGYYYDTLAILAILWIVWLFLLIFYKRPRRPVVPLPEPADLTIYERLRKYLEPIRAGTLDAAGQARLEMLLLRAWRQEHALAETPMYDSLHALGKSSQAAESLRLVQSWLHQPRSPVTREQIAAVIEAASTPPARLPLAPAFAASPA